MQRRKRRKKVENERHKQKTKGYANLLCMHPAFPVLTLLNKYFVGEVMVVKAGQVKNANYLINLRKLCGTFAWLN